MGDETAETTGGSGERPTDDADGGPTATRRSVLGLVAGAVGVNLGSSRARATESGTDTDAGPTVVGFGYGGVPLTDGDAGEEREFDSAAADADGAGGETHSLVVSGTGERSTYEFSVSGEVVSAARLSGWDGFSGGSARGVVWEGGDEYSFDGDVTDLSVDGDAEVFIDGTRVDPGDYGGGLHTLVVAGTGTKATYEFTASEEVVSGAGLSHWDGFSERNARGAVWAGRDEYSFRGEPTTLSLDGDAEVFVDGERVDPADYTGTSGSSTTDGRTASPEESFGYGEGGYGGTL
ncbi:hypothetical protein [Candidatus Halobonum tyrrellensis]|nr:hypothetical protein [Candidatus Halobonum tyrrellensis]